MISSAYEGLAQPGESSSKRVHSSVTRLNSCQKQITTPQQHVNNTKINHPNIISSIFLFFTCKLTGECRTPPGNLKPLPKLITIRCMYKDDIAWFKPLPMTLQTLLFLCLSYLLKDATLLWALPTPRFWLLKWTRDCLIWLAIANHEDCQFKVPESDLRLKNYTRSKGKLSFPLNDQKISWLC